MCETAVRKLQFGEDKEKYHHSKNASEISMQNILNEDEKLKPN